MTDNVLHILLVDDNKNEHVFFTHALKSIDQSVRLDSLTSGTALIERIYDSSRPLPDILFLDVNMPVKSGKECLALLRTDGRFDGMPIVMYSTSDAETDTDETFALGADLYVRKPVEIVDLAYLLRAVLAVYHQGNIRQTSREQYVISSASGF
jgi:CheY-like chemotaxis protein